MNQQELRRKIMSAFEPFEPARPETYVNCQSVRGDWDVLVELGSKIVNSEKRTCQLFSGHRGSGKSTELTRRLNDYLAAQGFLVVYFAADGEDLEPGDIQYEDILLSCVRHIIEAVPIDNTDNNPLMRWVQKNWEWVQNFLPEQMSFEELKGFGKLITTLKTIPDQRREIRKKINEKTPSLLAALNEFIDRAQANLPAQQERGIVLIVDSLDRIPHKDDGEKQNCREIYINRSTLMRGLRCHVVYTVPVAMVYSDTEADLRENYGSSLVLPMLMVRYPDGRVNRAGIDILRQLVRQRIEAIDPQLALNLDATSPASNVQAIFDSPKTTDNTPETFELLRKAHLLEYRYYRDNKLTIWRDVHPLIANCDKFKEAIVKLKEGE
jgi:AAA ATPase domain